MKDVIEGFEDEDGFGFIRYKGEEVIIIFSIPQKDEMIKIVLVKTDDGYKLKNIESTEEVA